MKKSFQCLCQWIVLLKVNEIQRSLPRTATATLPLKATNKKLPNAKITTKVTLRLEKKSPLKT